jgi:hypothetical protein
MEVAAADVLWRRSEALGMRYTTLLSDGDAKKYNHLNATKVYVNSTHIEKEECVNHVAKRLGTVLRKLCSTSSKKGTKL